MQRCSRRGVVSDAIFFEPIGWPVDCDGSANYVAAYSVTVGGRRNSLFNIILYSID